MSEQVLFNEETRPPTSLAILSNLTNINLNEILQSKLASCGKTVNIVNGEYDNVVQDSFKHSKRDCVIVLLEACNLSHNLHVEIEDYELEKVDVLINDISRVLKTICDNLRDTPLVFINSFTSRTFSKNQLKDSNLDLICEKLNSILKTYVSPNQLIINIDKIISALGVNQSFDFRFFFNAKSLYTTNFFKAYVEAIAPPLLTHLGQPKKVLVLDCDNTLWGGIIGEDGSEGIEMNPNKSNGIFFRHAQRIFSKLQSQGVLLALCSKNNAIDVQTVINNHPDFYLKDECFVIKKINWENKVDNLKSIAKSLNLGLDSFVFLDDSEFEIGNVSANLPDVTCLKVPENLSSYHLVLDKIERLFYKSAITKEDLLKTKMYIDNARRNDLLQSADSIETYLATLELTISVSWNEAVDSIRASQMTQKTNQFNLTTKRLTESEISSMISSNEFEVCTISVSDKFGDSGVTGLAIIKVDKITKSCNFEVFLLSCRIIGRNIEFKFFDLILNHLAKIKIGRVYASYHKTEKNMQVANFYDNLGLKKISSNDLSTFYQMDIASFNRNNYSYIKVL